MRGNCRFCECDFQVLSASNQAKSTACLILTQRKLQDYKIEKAKLQKSAVNAVNWEWLPVNVALGSRFILENWWGPHTSNDTYQGVRVATEILTPHRALLQVAKQSPDQQVDGRVLQHEMAACLQDIAESE